jgi:hypothetical protein
MEQYRSALGAVCPAIKLGSVTRGGMDRLAVVALGMGCGQGPSHWQCCTYCRCPAAMMYYYARPHCLVTSSGTHTPPSATDCYGSAAEWLGYTATVVLYIGRPIAAAEYRRGAVCQ